MGKRSSDRKRKKNRMPRKADLANQMSVSHPGDIEEIMSILGYLWKIPAPYSGADNGCHTLLSDVDEGGIRFSLTHTRRADRELRRTAAGISTSQQQTEAMWHIYVNAYTRTHTAAKSAADVTA